MPILTGDAKTDRITIRVLPELKVTFKDLAIALNLPERDVAQFAFAVGVRTLARLARPYPEI